jgi:hypothetical protein
MTIMRPGKLSVGIAEICQRQSGGVKHSHNSFSHNSSGHKGASGSPMFVIDEKSGVIEIVGLCKCA